MMAARVRAEQPLRCPRTRGAPASSSPAPGGVHYAGGYYIAHSTEAEYQGTWILYLEGGMCVPP